MATPALIDLSNYNTLLVQSTQGRAGTPDGNIFFDVATGQIELITAEEAANVTYPVGHPNYSDGLPEANPLTNQLGVKMEALYAFEAKERRIDETLRQYDKYFRGSFKFAGAYEIVNSRKFAGTDRVKIRGSGWIERASDGGVDRIYYGNVSLANVEATSQPYYQLSAGAAPVDYAKAGDIDEAIQVFGSTANTPSDAGAGNFDTRTYLAISLRTFGYNYDRKVLADSGVTEMGGYSTGFAIGETPHNTTGSYNLADVYGGGQIAPWTGMTLERLAAPQTETGFNEADGNFSWVLNNTLGGSLDQCVAFLDALAQTDDDIDSGAITVTNGKRVNTWYTYDAQGRILTRSGADGDGLFIESLPANDQQRVVFTDDAGNTKTYPFNVQVNVSVGANAAADANAWYHAYFLDGPGANDFNTANAITVQDNVAAEVKGNVSAATTISFVFDYDGDTLGGTAGTDKDIVFECEGDGTATAAKTIFTITRTAIVSAACEPGLETNV